LDASSVGGKSGLCAFDKPSEPAGAGLLERETFSGTRHQNLNTTTEVPKMKFRATKEQLLQIGTHAVRASGVFGMGFLRGNGTEDFTLKEDENSHDSGLGEKALSTRGLHLDYVLGRMVKLYIQACGEGIY